MSEPFSRREILGLLGGAGIASAVGLRTARAQSRRSSRVRGVQIGVMSDCFRTEPADTIIPTMLKVGLTEVELLSNHAEALAGAPLASRPPTARAPSPPTLNDAGLLPRCAALPLVLPLKTAGPEIELPTPTPEQQSRQERLWDWRRQTTPATWAAVRRQFDDAGIDLRVLWYGLGYSGPPDVSDEEIDYAFRMARGLGVRVVAGSTRLQFAPRIAAAATKYDLTFAAHTNDNIHNPEQLATPDAYERFLAVSDRLRICLDIGYFTAAGFDSVSFLKKHRDRVSDIHLKDRKRSRPLGGDVTNDLVNNWPWGQGDAPIREVLRLLQRDRWDVPAQIEYEYNCRSTSDVATELARCYAFCRATLLA